MGIAVISVLVVDQSVQYWLLADGYIRGRRVAPFDPPVFCPSQVRLQQQVSRHVETGRPEARELSFDVDLGWAPEPGNQTSRMNYDWAGCRVGPTPLARERNRGLKRVVCVGCSFTQGEEVADEEAWPYLLDVGSESHEVANLAMGAYGLDQALMRYRRDGRPLTPDELWVGWLPSASLRLVTQWRPAERHWAKLARFKPRFRVDLDGELVPVANPARSVAHMHTLLSSQSAFLAALQGGDFWVARSPLAYAPAGTSWLHHTGLGRMALTLHEHGGRDVDRWLDDEEGEIFKLLIAVVAAFQQDARDAGIRLRVLILPDRPGLVSTSARGIAPWSKVQARWEALGVEVVDLTLALQAAEQQGTHSLWAPGGHYSRRGNEVVAEALAPLLN